MKSCKILFSLNMVSPSVGKIFKFIINPAWMFEVYRLLFDRWRVNNFGRALALNRARLLLWSNHIWVLNQAVWICLSFGCTIPNKKICRFKVVMKQKIEICRKTSYAMVCCLVYAHKRKKYSFFACEKSQPRRQSGSARNEGEALNNQHQIRHVFLSDSWSLQQSN